MREAETQKMARLYGHQVGPQTAITITAGAIQALITTVRALGAPSRRNHSAQPLFAQLQILDRVGWRGGGSHCFDTRRAPT